MGDWIKRAVIVALLGVAARQGIAWWKRSHSTHQLTFRVEGPPMCHVRITTVAGSPLANEDTSIPWASAPVSVPGSAEAEITVDIPLSCGWAPSDVHCAIDRDGQPWRDAEASRVTDTRDGSLASFRCRLEAHAGD